MSLDLNAIISLVSMVVALIAAGTGIAMTRPNRNKALAEAEASNADAVKSYAMATATYALEVKTLRDDVKTMHKELDERDSIIRELRVQLDDLKDWVTRLVHQVKSLGKKPVPFRQDGTASETL